MAPNLYNQTSVPSCSPSSYQITRGPSQVYYNNGTFYESYEYENTTSSITYWSHRDKYDTSFTIALIYPTKQIEKNVKKLLKKMADVLCKEGWIDHKSYYPQIQLKPIGLRGVRYDGRGWANL